jgi:hypothetical protein
MMKGREKIKDKMEGMEKMSNAKAQSSNKIRQCQISKSSVQQSVLVSSEILNLTAYPRQES